MIVDQPMRDAVPARRWAGACLLALVLGGSAAADQVDDAVAATLQGQKAARESQQRVDRIAAETRSLLQRQQDVRAQALQASVYAAQLEQQAQAEEQGRAGLEAQIAGIHQTEAGLLPLARQMVADLDRFVAADLPFQVELRRRRVEDLKQLLDDPARNTADKFRRVLDVYRSEVDFGYSLGAEEAQLTIDGQPTPVAIVRIGRVGLYYLSADRKRAGYWNVEKRGWRGLDAAAAPEVWRALQVARGEAPPELLELPLQVPR